MYRIPRGGKGAATARRLECNRQNGGKSKIEAKKCFLLFLHKAVEIWQIMGYYIFTNKDIRSPYRI